MGFVNFFYNFHIVEAAIKPLKWIIVDKSRDEFQASCPYCHSTNFVLLDDPIFYCVYCGRRVKGDYYLTKEQERMFIDDDSYNVAEWIVEDYDLDKMSTKLLCSCCGEKSIKMTPYSEWKYCGKCGVSIFNSKESVVGVSEQIKDIINKPQTI